METAQTEEKEDQKKEPDESVGQVANGEQNSVAIFPSKAKKNENQCNFFVKMKHRYCHSPRIQGSKLRFFFVLVHYFDFFFQQIKENYFVEHIF